MDREILLAGLALLVCGPSLLAAGLVPARRAMWKPLVPTVLAAGILVGWALQEPSDSDESFAPAALVLLAPMALIWLRAGWRALRALRIRARPAAATLGLFRPRVVVAPELRARLDAAELAAVLAHEAAHARHRDPLRLWLAQIVTDLQWPCPRARLRLDTWRRALELARDDEARANGVDGADLAAALVVAAKLQSQPTLAGLLGDGSALAARVERLLAPLPPATMPRTARWSLALGAALAGALVVGALYGETLVRWLPGVR